MPAMKPVLVLLTVAALLLVLGCAAGPNELSGTPDGGGSTAGFWVGLWHGFIVLFTFIISLFNDGLSVYDVHNSGHLYDLGFVLGVMMFFGGGGGGASRKSRRR
jgi:hypothetical protein